MKSALGLFLQDDGNELSISSGGRDEGFDAECGVGHAGKVGVISRE